MAMRTLTGDLWTVEAGWRIIPTNAVVRVDGRAVMGAGVALQAAIRYPELERQLGWILLTAAGTPRAAPVAHFPDYRLTCLPTKHDWRKPADLSLIERGLRQFLTDLPSLGVTGSVALPLLGGGLGGLPAMTVRSLLGSLLDDRFVLVLRARM